MDSRGPPGRVCVSGGDYTHVGGGVALVNADCRASVQGTTLPVSLCQRAKRQTDVVVGSEKGNQEETTPYSPPAWVFR